MSLRCEEAAEASDAEGAAVGKLSVEPSPRDQLEDDGEEDAFPIELLGRTLIEEEQLERSGARKARAANERSCRRMRSG